MSESEPSNPQPERWVDISFDCLPLRSVGRLDAPIDASPKFQQLCGRIKAAIEKHGSHNSYFLYNSQCTYRFTNDAEKGMVQFFFEGTVLTDVDDLTCESYDLSCHLHRETCDWLTEPIVDWLEQTVAKSVAVEFDRFIAAGDLDKAKQRIEKIQSMSDESGGFVGMYL
jgi:hypothetical protein